MGGKGKPFSRNDSRINKSGRPQKGMALTEILNSKLDDLQSGKMKREILAEKIIELALSGDIHALRYVFDRCDGKPRESITLKTDALDAKLKLIMAGK